MYVDFLFRNIANGMTQSETKSKTKTARIVVIVYGLAEAFQTHICENACMRAAEEILPLNTLRMNIKPCCDRRADNQCPLSYN